MKKIKKQTEVKLKQKTVGFTALLDSEIRDITSITIEVGKMILLANVNKRDAKLELAEALELVKGKGRIYEIVLKEIK